MLDGYSEVEEDAVALIKAYIGLKRGDFEATLNPSGGAPPQAHSVRMLAQNTRSLAERARSILARADAAAISDQSTKNLTAIAEELELATTEAEDAAHPDSVWSGLERRTKDRITEGLPVTRERADRLRARIRGDLRKQTPKK